MIWVKSATRMPSSGCIGSPCALHASCLLDALRNLSRIAKNRGAVDPDAAQQVGAARGIFFIKLVKPLLIRCIHRDELHLLRASLRLARLNGGASLLRHRRFPNGCRCLEQMLLLGV